MSSEALAWAFKVDVRPSAVKFTLIALCECANYKTGSIHPSIAHIEEITGQNRKTIIANISKLEAIGLIADTGERIGATKQIKVYRACVETVPQTERFQKRNSTENDGKQSQKRDTEPSREPSEDKAKALPSKRAKPKKSDPFVLPEWIPADAWDRFVAMRKSLGKPISDDGKPLAVTKLRNLADDGHPPGAVLDQSTFSSWLGLFPIKDQSNDRRTSQQPGSRTAGAVAAVMERLGDRATTGAALADGRSGRPAPSLPSPVRTGWHEPG